MSAMLVAREDMCFCWSKKDPESGIREHGEMVSVKNHWIGKERLGGYFADQTLMVMVVVYFHPDLQK